MLIIAVFIAEGFFHDPLFDVDAPQQCHECGKHDQAKTEEVLKGNGKGKELQEKPRV